MCFSPIVSWTTAALGITVGVIAKAKNKPATLYIPPAYFGFMEILQGLMYTQLHNPIPYFPTLLIYVAISYYHCGCF